MKLEVIKNNLLDTFQIDIDVYNDNTTWYHKQIYNKLNKEAIRISRYGDKKRKLSTYRNAIRNADRQKYQNSLLQALLLQFTTL